MGRRGLHLGICRSHSGRLPAIPKLFNTEPVAGRMIRRMRLIVCSQPMWILFVKERAARLLFRWHLHL